MRYKPAILDCPIYGEHIEGDMPVISHAIKGCIPKLKCTCIDGNSMSQMECRIHGISAQLDRTQMK